MPDSKISALTAVVTPADTDEFAVNQSGTSKKETLAQIRTGCDVGVSGGRTIYGGTAANNTLTLVGNSNSQGCVAVGGALAGGVTKGVLTVRNGGDNNNILNMGTAAAPYGVSVGYLADPESGVALRVAFDGTSATTLLQIDGDSGGTPVGGDLPLEIIAANDQTVDLTQWKNSAGTVLAAVGAEGGIQMTGAGSKPTAGSAYRGMIWYTPGGAGVLDKLEVCRKDAADAYAWVTLF